MDTDWRGQVRHRCKHEYLGTTPKTKCVLLRGHVGQHEGYTPESNLSIFWTEADNEAILESHREAMRDALTVKLREHAPHSSTALMGWRVWELKTTLNMLHSVSAHVPWTGPVMRTMENRVPEPYSYAASDIGILRDFYDAHLTDYGVYSYKTPMHVLRYLYGYRFQWTPSHSTANYEGVYSVIGQVENSGIVVEHTMGWRAQIATVSELWYIESENSYAFGETDRIVESLTERYQCPVRAINYFSREGDLNLHHSDRLLRWAKWRMGEPDLANVEVEWDNNF